MSRLTSGGLADLGDALAAIAPAGVRTGCRPITASDVAALHDVEAAAIAAAVPKRRDEFATGRVLLRTLLGVDTPLPVRSDRAPQLPAGFVGSIAHTGRLAVAAVAPTAVSAALGIDVEPATVLDDDMARVILRPDESKLDAHLAFTLKEAVYKAWSGLGGGMLDHHDVRLAVGDEGSFTGTVVARGERFDGRWLRATGHWFALVVVPPDRALGNERIAFPDRVEEDGTAGDPRSE